MRYRQTNRTFFLIFFLCGISIVLVTWTIGEKFISPPGLALLVNLVVGGIMAFLFGRYLENKVNRSLDFINHKIREVGQGDLTQRFKEDPDDALPYGLANELGGMMRFLRENIASLWKTSAMLTKQLDQFIAATQTSLVELRREAGELQPVGRQLSRVKQETVLLAKTISNLRVNTASHLTSVSQTTEAAASFIRYIQGNKGWVRDLGGSLKEIQYAIENLSTLLRDFTGLFASVAGLGKSMGEVINESSLVKLNTSIDATREQHQPENYQKIVEEIQTVLEKMQKLSQEFNSISSTAGIQVDTLAQKLKAGGETLKAGISGVDQAQQCVTDLSRQSTETVTSFTQTVGYLRNLEALVDTVDQQTTVFDISIKTSLGNFDKLAADLQITLLKFQQLEEKIGAITENLKKLDEFKNKFEIA